jgi:hypothetical protein
MTTETAGELDAALRARAAELVLLRRYDAKRRALGHDYGVGQRWGELARRQRELEARTPHAYELERDTTPAELAGAYARVGARRYRRAVAEAERYGSTGVQRTLQAWQTIRRLYGAEVSS